MATHAHSVLIVEDSEDARDSLALLVELAGHHVVKAANGTEALALIQTGRVRACAIVLDLLMPQMDGLMFLRELRASVHAKTPVVAFTGHEGARKEALAMGCTAALLKPAKPGDLLRLIEHHCPPAA
jgi:CheY-like chemotaxis protein